MSQAPALTRSVGTPRPGAINLPTPAGGRSDFKTDRRVLRSILLTDQTPYITYNAAFSHYTTTPTSIVAHFADGSSAEGSLLVGADGTRSKVAAQLVGDAAMPRDLGLRVIYGKTVMTPSLKEKVHPQLTAGAAFVVNNVPGKRLVLVLDSMTFTAPGSPDNYYFWALSGSKDAFEMDDDTLLSAQGPAAAEITRRLIAHWDSSIRVILDEQKEEQTAALRLTSSDPEGVRWSTDRRVTLLGDAMHAMPPTGGQGANSALKDAAMLGILLSRDQGRTGGDGWAEETILEYEQASRYSLGDVVALAVLGAKHLLRAA